MSPVWDLARLAAELQDWYNRISQIWAVKELCQSFLTGNQPHTQHRNAPDPSRFWGATIANNKTPLIHLKLRKCSPHQHPPAPEGSKGRGGGKKAGMCHAVWVPKQLLGARSQPQPPRGTHGVVVLSDHRRAHEVALTPIHLGTLVGENARHPQHPGEKESSRSVLGTGEHRAAHPKRTLPLTRVAAAQSLTQLPRAHPLPNTHATAQ